MINVRKSTKFSQGDANFVRVLTQTSPARHVRSTTLSTEMETANQSALSVHLLVRIQVYASAVFRDKIPSMVFAALLARLFQDKLVWFLEVRRK